MAQLTFHKCKIQVLTVSYQYTRHLYRFIYYNLLLGKYHVVYDVQDAQYVSVVHLTQR